MKIRFPIQRGMLPKFRSLRKPPVKAESDPQGGRGESLFKLHETQNRVITSIYKISIAGLVAIFLILISFTLFMFTDPATPIWVGYILIAVEILLIVGFLRTLHDFQAYQKHYLEVSTRLRDLLRQQFQRGEGTGKGGEHRLITALKPKEHTGWDAKFCQQCAKSLELTASVCQHCGQEQGQTFMN